jgi:TrmH family RNA methyltransferase
LENTQYAGNLGTMMRSALAFGVTNIYLVGKTVDPFSPEVVRASMGAIFGINIVIIDDINTLKDQNNIALTLDKSANLLNTYPKIHNTYLLWLGNEGRGLTRQALELCQTKLRIEISGLIDSLNVSEAAAIAMYALA